ncbi:TIR domain-containing protein [Vibrio breoganii]|uniref:TIR domain-containing protein n=1 Tax=Vibrio breoganii TaxID=553239 RepID=UPI0039A5A875
MTKCTKNTFDAAIFVLSPDDVVKIRGTEQTVTRDNVVFELGMFIGRLGADKNVHGKALTTKIFICQPIYWALHQEYMTINEAITIYKLR